MTDSIRVLDPAAGEWTAVADDAAIAAQGAGEGTFPLAVKANIGVRGFARSAGCRALDVAPEAADAPVVAAFRAHGAVVVGMTNMHELAFGITSQNASYGNVRLPGHEERVAGGSSGGSAAAVARGIVPLALGSDTGGSVSVPASFCGVVGFRPSTGRWPTAGLVGLSWTRDTPGVFARTVAEAARADQWVAGETMPSDDSGRVRPRLGVPHPLVDALDPRTAAAFERAMGVVADHAELVDVDLAGVLELTQRAEMPIVLWESRRLLGDVAASVFDCTPADAYERLTASVVSPDVAAVLSTQLSAPITPDQYAAAQRDTIAARMLAADIVAANAIDALVFPSAPAPAPRTDVGPTVDHLGREVSTFGLFTRNTSPGTMLGVPMLTVPMPLDAGELPMGLTMQGRRFDDTALLGLGHRVEAWLAGA
ncbi:indole acetimide hydrolase [Pseudoclavibacter endophyticus]|uniref:Amidase n=1 Tax=Pseudoclavibacter endophyticus TaxID=1778590 RepID=A0A6H9WRJ5_9MICO|nr:amidase family protein [Pseudoclavibacter endophyticus]KAB1649567.1 amidase [Pseudoclavibacter endophyticus]GGA61562.1 indole acetimide hydrolase [Pseudoclavibacter endophyticus]